MPCYHLISNEQNGKWYQREETLSETHKRERAAQLQASAELMVIVGV